MNTAAEVLDNAVRQFQARGFLVVPGLCPRPLVEHMVEIVQRNLASGRGPVELEAEVGYPGAPASAGAPGGRTVRRLKQALDRDPVFREWAVAPAVLKWVRELLGSRDIRVVRAHHNCIMTKHPEFSSATGWHQDTRYWSFERGELVNAWTALGVESENNGGMRLIPGSHRMALPAGAFDAQRFFRPDRGGFDELMAGAVQVALQPGDVLFFHAGLLHAAGQNRTAGRKFSVAFSYRAADNPPLPGTRSAGAEDLEPGK